MVQELTPFELERKKRIEENTRRLAELGVLQAAKDLAAVCRPPVQQRNTIPRPRVPRPKPARRQQPQRASRRVSGQGPEYAGYDSCEEEAGGRGACLEYTPLKDLLAGSDAALGCVVAPEAAATWQLARCNSAGRGSFYDSTAGITCHFCRQKKLCGEEGCPRCSTRNTQAECIGKTECGRCGGATGRFCRACLLLRYGQTLEDVRAEMASGTWLCPHCYEEEHPEAGWICNSSICMKRRGYKPTGIAIYEAQQRGYSSVAHWLQAQLTAPSAATATAAATSGQPAAAVEEQQAAAPVAKEGEEEVLQQQDVPLAQRLTRSRKAAAGEEVEEVVPVTSSSSSAADGTPTRRATKPPAAEPAAAAGGGGDSSQAPAAPAATTPTRSGKEQQSAEEAGAAKGAGSQEVVRPATPVLADVSNTGHRPAPKTRSGAAAAAGGWKERGQKALFVAAVVEKQQQQGQKDVPLAQRLTRSRKAAAAAVVAPAAGAERAAKRVRKENMWL